MNTNEVQGNISTFTIKYALGNQKTTDYIEAIL